MKDNNKALESIKALEKNIKYFENKIKQSKTVALICYIAFGFFLSAFIILLTLYFTVIHQSLLLTFSIVFLVLCFIFIQVGIVNTLLIKYLYQVKLNNLTNVINIFKKDINK